MLSREWRKLAAGVVLVVLASLASGVSRAEGTPVSRFEVSDYEVIGNNPLAADDTQSLLSPHTGKDRAVADLLTAAKALETAIRAQGYAFHRVILPPQTLSGGVVRLVVVAFRLGSLDVPTDEYFSEANLLGSLPAVQPGETLNLQDVSAALRFANRHSFKDVDLIFRQSPNPRQVDARLQASTHDPQNFYLTLNNSGSEETGRSRLMLLYQHANFFDRDHELMASFTTSPENVSDVMQFALSYSVPLYDWGARLEGFAIYSDTDSGRVADFDITGAGTLYGLTYAHSLGAEEGYYHELRLGITDKRFDNDVRFEGVQLATDVRSLPLGLQYALESESDRGNWQISLQWNLNLPWGSHNDQLSYSANRAGAERDWQAWRSHGRLEQALGERWLLRGRFNAQYSSEALIAGEQIGLGGAHSVRGYEERELAGDSGYTLALELWWPNLIGQLSAYGFADYGSLRLNDTQPGEHAGDSLASVGIGMDWRGLPGFSTTADLAYALQDGEQTDKGDLGLHLELIYRF